MGTRGSTSPCCSNRGVVTRSAKVIGECAVYDARFSHGHLKYDTMNSAPSERMRSLRSLMLAPDEAALKRAVCVTIQFVMKPPYDAPITPSRSGSATPAAIIESTPAMMSL